MAKSMMKSKCTSVAAGPKNVIFSNGTNIKSAMPETVISDLYLNLKNDHIYLKITLLARKK
jgi:hypothetical protein